MLLVLLWNSALPLFQCARFKCLPLLLFKVCWVLLCVLRVMKVVLGNNGMMINDRSINVIIILLEG